MGMAGVFPLILKERGATFTQLAWFSACSWPFALKLFWAPFVDTWSLPGLGVRKSWLVPAQILIAAGLYWIAENYATWLGDDFETISSSGVMKLSGAFFALYGLAATQDIAVDGWALELLGEEEAGEDSSIEYAGTCNSVGQSAGYFVAFSGFMALEAMDICSLEDFMRFWAWAFLICTVLVTVLKREEPRRTTNGATDSKKSPTAPNSSESAYAVYRKCVRLFMHRPVPSLAIVLITWRLPFTESLVGFKLQEKGISKETLAGFATATTPFQLVLPWMVTRLMANSSPMRTILAVYPFRLICGLLNVLLIKFVPTNLDVDHPWTMVSFYVTAMILTVLQSAFSTAMFTAQMSFFSKISDPSMGGTYMTVLNTLSNFGGHIAMQLSLVAVDRLNGISEGSGWVDGFDLLTGLGIVFGFVWLRVFWHRLRKLEHLPLKAWKVGQVKAE